MRSGGTRGGSKAHAFVETCGTHVLSAEAYKAEVVPGLIYESGHQRSANAFISPPMPHVDTPDTPDVRTAGKGVNVQAAHGHQQALIQMAAEGLSRGVKAILRARPFLHQRVNEAVSLIPRLRLQPLQARDG
jgi:hypothetical protein